MVADLAVWGKKWICYFKMMIWFYHPHTLHVGDTEDSEKSRYKNSICEEEINSDSVVTPKQHRSKKSAVQCAIKKSPWPP